MALEREEEIIVDESQTPEEQASPVIWERFIKQGIVCAILLITVLWLNKTSSDGLLSNAMTRFKVALKTDSNSSFGFIQRQPFINQMISWSKGIWSGMEEQQTVTGEKNLIPPVPGVMRKRFGWISEAPGREPIFHPGVDLEAPEGSPVRSGGRGTIQEIRQESDGLWRVTVIHDENNRSIYGNIKQVIVRVGDKIESGQEIGAAGRSGLEGQTVHWEVWQGIQPVDPQPLLRMR